MAGKPNDKWLKTMIEKHGSLEKVKEIQTAIGKRGGLAKVPKGFAVNRELAMRAGRKAGTISKTGHKFIEIKDGYRYYVALDTGKVVKYKHEDKYKG
jgi:general stress protein YciG